MFDNGAVRPGVNAVSRFAYVAGIVGIPVWFVFLGRYLGSAVG